MTTKYNSPVCPCGCGNRDDDIITEEEVNDFRKKMKGRRYCIHNGKIFLPTLEDIKKHNYCLVEDIRLDEWLREAETEHEKWSFTKLYGHFTAMNAFVESVEDSKK